MENKTNIKKNTICLISFALLIILGLVVFYYLNKSPQHINQQTVVKQDLTANEIPANRR